VNKIGENNKVFGVIYDTTAPLEVYVYVRIHACVCVCMYVRMY